MTVADVVKLVGAVVIDGAGVIGLHEFAPVIVRPSVDGSDAEGGACGGQIGALTNIIHGVVIAGNEGVVSFIFFFIEDVAVLFPSIGDGVGRGGAGFDKVSAESELLIGEGIVAEVGDLIQTTGVVVAIADGVFWIRAGTARKTCLS